MVTKRLDSHEMVGDGRILFLQWEVLNIVGDVGDAQGIELEMVFNVETKTIPATYDVYSYSSLPA
jgi:hypothetical protein